MSNVQMWALLVGFLMPLLISALQQSTWSNPLRAGIAFLACAIAGGVTAWLAGDFKTTDIVSAVLVVLTTALATYKGLWKPTGVAPAIESRTSPSRPESEPTGPTPVE